MNSKMEIHRDVRCIFGIDCFCGCFVVALWITIVRFSDYGRLLSATHPGFCHIVDNIVLQNLVRLVIVQK